jgi:hypothetical protein
MNVEKKVELWLVGVVLVGVVVVVVLVIMVGNSYQRVGLPP